MAANDLLLREGTAITWKSTGGTYALSHGATFADGEAYMGAVADLGATFYGLYSWFLEIDTGGTAPTAGTIAEVFVGYSPDGGTTYTGGVTGSDAQYKSGEEDEWLAGLSPVGPLIYTNDANTNQIQCIREFWTPSARRVVPVVIQRSGQTAGAEADFILTLLPLIQHPEAA